MAIQQQRHGTPGSEQGLGVSVGGQAGTGSLSRGGDGTGLQGVAAGALEAVGTKPLKPLPHAVIDYAWAGTMIAAPWLFGFSRNRKATMHAVGSGLGILGLSLFTRYPLGVVKLIPFPAHGVVEALAGAMTATAPWLMGFSRDRSAKLTHVMSGLGTLAVVAMTDYNAAERQGNGRGEGGESS
ncbi:MAG TPA: SPW repeat protein [Pyrinomonadaceae bacterium]|nr:SPW repeat protein [Pyrinomonadaceae bacterium]